jgi:hypothetical protein
MFDNRLKYALVGYVIDSITKREVNRIVFTCANADVAKFARAWEIFAVLVERDRHNAVCRVEGFLNPVSVMDIDIDVKNSLFETEQFKDPKDDVLTASQK